MIIRNSRYKEVLPDTIAYKGQTYTKAYAKGKLLFANTDDDYEYQYFTVESLEDGNVITFTIGSGVTTSMLSSIAYSTDNGTNWTTLTNDGTTEQTLSVTLNTVGKAIWKGIGTNTGIVDNVIADRCTIFASKTMNVYGNITSLLKGDNFYNNYYMSQAGTYVGLFYKDASYDANIVDASDLVLPATTLSNNCYYEMFRHCQKLLYAPKLPATTITSGAYRGMFRDCIVLLEAPELPATTLGTWCYTHMFYNCRAITKAPELPSTTINQTVYYGMFYNCIELIEAPELPAPTLYNQCYREMFRSCTSLNYIKCLATDISASNCTDGWVRNVAATGTFIKADGMNSWTIDSVNGIPIGWTLHNYENCTVTLSVNDSSYGTVDGAGTYHTGDMVTIKANAADGYRFVGWYDGSTLVSQNEGYTFEIWTNVSYQAVFEVGQVDYSSQYFTIESLEDGNEVKFTKPSEVSTTIFQSISYSTDGTNWTTIQNVDNQPIDQSLGILNTGGKMYFKGSATAYATGNEYGNVWRYSTLITNKTCNVYGNMMSLLYGENFSGQIRLTEDYAFMGLFARGNVVSAADLVLPVTNMTFCCYKYLFSHNTALATPPVLPSTSLADQCYEGMFAGCTSLATAPVLPATTTVGASYQYMFSGCSSLATAPALPATTLSQSCYRGMFEYCTSLATAPTLAVNNLESQCYEGMFKGCTSLQSVTLPATNLGWACYFHMLEGCTSLEAIDLPATAIVEYCYDSIIAKCTGLKSVSVHAVTSGYSIDFGAELSASGTYYVPRTATGYILDACPTGWTISKTLS